MFFFSGAIGVLATIVAVPLLVISVFIMPWHVFAPMLLVLFLLWLLFHHRRAKRVAPNNARLQRELDAIGRRYGYMLEGPPPQVQAPAGMTDAQRQDLHAKQRANVTPGRHRAPMIPWVRDPLPPRLPRGERVDLTRFDSLDEPEDPDYEG